MCFLVNFVKERIQSELVEKLYKVSKQSSVKGIARVTAVRRGRGGVEREWEQGYEDGTFYTSLGTPFLFTTAS